MLIINCYRFIGEPLIGQCSNSLEGFFPRLTFHTWMNFNEITVSMLPRESRIIFVLYGCNKVAVEGGGANASTNDDTTNGGGNQELTKVELGWSSLQFFDYERKMIQGHYFLAMWPPSADKFLVPSPPRGAHPYGDYCPILSIEIPSYGGTLYFPEIEPNMNVPKLDFLSLDGNLQEELMDTRSTASSPA
jgi:phosphatidylinositol-4-phosphate 3-kinase